MQNAADQLQTLLGAQGYAAYEQQQYYAWYQPQVLANAGGGNLTINPAAFSLKVNKASDVKDRMAGAVSVRKSYLSVTKADSCRVFENWRLR